MPEFERNPSSLLVPIGTTAMFECKARHCPRTCSVYWIINDSSTTHNHQQDQYEDQGFIFEHKHNTTSNVYSSRLVVPGSVEINNTEFCCVVHDGINHPKKSDQATLIVVSGISYCSRLVK